MVAIACVEEVEVKRGRIMSNVKHVGKLKTETGKAESGVCHLACSVRPTTLPLLQDHPSWAGRCAKQSTEYLID